MMAATPQRILFLLPTMHGGGAERIVVTLLRHLDRQRFRSTLAVVSMEGAAYKDDVPPDIELIDMNCARVRFALPRMFRLIWSVRPDIVFATVGHLNLALAMLRPLLPSGTRYVARATANVSEVIADGVRWPALWSWAYRFFYRRLDLVVCQSRSMRDDLVWRFRVPPQKSVVINNPVDTNRIQQMCSGAPPQLPADPARATQLRLLAVGRLVNQKGFDLLIEAAALCRRPGLTVTILGEGPLRTELEQLARDRGVRDQIHFAGFQSNPYPYFRQVDALVLSSRYEGFPNVVLEALACGVPVISTPASGVTEIVQGIAGCAMADEISAPALAREIDRFKKGTRVPRDAVKPYQVDAIVRRYEEILA